jgi:hypothetical protein
MFSASKMESQRERRIEALEGADVTNKIENLKGYKNKQCSTTLCRVIRVMRVM